MDRCALFVDASYALANGALAVHGTRNRDSVSWDYAGLLKLLGGLSRDRTGLPLLRCYWYDTAADGNRAAEHDTLADIPGVKLRVSKVRPNRKEGVEAEIRKDLTALARNRAVTDVIIVSAEEDLAPAIAEVQDLGIRTILLHIAADGDWAVSRMLRQECDDIIDISAGHLRPYVDLIQGAEPQLAPAGYREQTARAAQASGPHQGMAAAGAPLYASPVAVGYERAQDSQPIGLAGGGEHREVQPQIQPLQPVQAQQPVQPVQAQQPVHAQQPAHVQQYPAADVGREPVTVGASQDQTYGQSAVQGQSGYGQGQSGYGQGAGQSQSGYGQNGFGTPDLGPGPNGQASAGSGQPGLGQGGFGSNGVPANGAPAVAGPGVAGGGAGANAMTATSQQSAGQRNAGRETGVRETSGHPGGGPVQAGISSGHGQGGLPPSGAGPNGTPPGVGPNGMPPPGTGQLGAMAPQNQAQAMQPGQSLGLPQQGPGMPAHGQQGMPRQSGAPGQPPIDLQHNGLMPMETQRAALPQRQLPPGNGMQYPQERTTQYGGQPPPTQFGGPQGPAGYSSAPYGAPQPSGMQAVPPVAISVAEAVQSAHAEGFGFGEAVARDAPAL